MLIPSAINVLIRLAAVWSFAHKKACGLLRLIIRPICRASSGSQRNNRSPSRFKPCANIDQMFDRSIRGTSIIDTDEVVFAPGGILHEAPVEQDDRDSRTIQHCRNLPIHLVHAGNELEWSKEDTGDSFRNVLLAKLLGDLLFGLVHAD